MADELLDSQLLARARLGELAAFNALVELHQTRVYNLCLHMLASPEAAEDATQETFLSAYRNIARFRGEVFRAWLLRIAVNACTDELRRRRRRPQISLEEGPAGVEGVLEPPDPSESPEEWTLRAEMNRYLREALVRLPEDQRAAIVLCDVQGLTYEEIASALNTSLGTVKSRISRGRARLREYLLAQKELISGQIRHTTERVSEKDVAARDAGA